MKNAGVLMLVAGLLFCLYAVSMDTSVAVDVDRSNPYLKNMPERVNNFGLMHEQSTYLVLSAGIFIFGVILFFVGRNSERNEEPEPYEASYIPPVVSVKSAADEIEKLLALKEKGALTDVEFQQEKEKIIRN